jgi:type VI secretion system protein ImpJ
MSLTSKPLWLEGMFVRPQHFQQHDRWIEHQLERRTAPLSSFGWGVSELTFDASLLELGQLAVARCRAIMPDGSIIDVPDAAAAPAARTVPTTAQNLRVFLTVPVDPRDGVELATESVQRRRYRGKPVSVRNVTAGEREPVELTVGEPLIEIAFDGEPLDERIAMPVARIGEVDASGRVRLVDGFIPPCLGFGASPRLVAVLNDVRAMLRSRGDALGERADPSRATAESAGLVDLLALSIVNGAEAALAHIAAVPTLHPEVLIRELVRLVGSLSTFDASHRRPPALEPYRHDALETTLEPILAALRQTLQIVVERNAVPLPLQERGYGILTATIADRSIIQTGARFILAAIANMPADALRTQLQATMKVGSVEQIRDLVNLQLPGIPLRPLPVAPRELPYLQGAVYFELDQSSELWRSIPRSAAFALHVSGEYPDLHLEFWAIRAAKR